MESVFRRLHMLIHRILSKLVEDPASWSSTARTFGKRRVLSLRLSIASELLSSVPPFRPLCTSDFHVHIGTLGILSGGQPDNQSFCLRYLWLATMGTRYRVLNKLFRLYGRLWRKNGVKVDLNDCWINSPVDIHNWVLSVNTIVSSSYNSSSNTSSRPNALVCKTPTGVSSTGRPSKTKKVTNPPTPITWGVPSSPCEPSLTQHLSTCVRPGTTSKKVKGNHLSLVVRPRVNSYKLFEYYFNTVQTILINQYLRRLIQFNSENRMWRGLFKDETMPILANGLM